MNQKHVLLVKTYIKVDYETMKLKSTHTHWKPFRKNKWICLKYCIISMPHVKSVTKI